MEFGLREYLLILGGVLILGLLIDGIRRTIKHRRHGLKLDLMAAPPELPEYAEVSPPRPAKRGMTPQSLEPEIHHDPLFHDDEQGQLALWSVEIKPSVVKSKVDPDAVLDSSVVLADSLDAATARGPKSRTSQAERVEPVFDEPLFATSNPAESSPLDSTHWEAPAEPMETIADTLSSADLVMQEGVADSVDADGVARTADVLPNSEGLDQHASDMAILADASGHPVHGESERPSGGVTTVMSRLFSKFAARTTPDPTPEQPSPREDDGIVSTARPARKSDDAGAELGIARPPTEKAAEPEVGLDDLVIIRVRAARAEKFEALDLHTACLRAGLRFTVDQVYSRYPLDDTQPPLFTLVNGIEPGVFEVEARSVDTPLLVLFLVLKDQAEPVFAVTEMVTGARAIARAIGGEVLDDQDTPITREWIDLARARAGHLSLTR